MPPTLQRCWRGGEEIPPRGCGQLHTCTIRGGQENAKEDLGQRFLGFGGENGLEDVGMDETKDSPRCWRSFLPTDGDPGAPSAPPWTRKRRAATRQGCREDRGGSHPSRTTPTVAPGGQEVTARSRPNLFSLVF